MEREIANAVTGASQAHGPLRRVARHARNPPMNEATWPKVFAFVGLAVMGFVLAFYSTSAANAGIAAALLGRTSDGADLLSMGSAAFLVGIAMFAVFGYLALKGGWSKARRG